ncbi:TetR/AcrR family transcriptional regulator [Humibacter sp. RRB41]|uniref:TetR/AcrR family transcriptional regulator n=1 Tax=Humibacter sp. RRB41 TaxID=2919946 RepID=UPI001FA9E45D|nr:TetR/AcrR family transcriptional regulator [Humibacter sp. RRB41]
MPRSGEDARRRLQDAALELYLERGYDATTTAAIAARAGVNHRTFFRHFPDKREVLFGGEDDLRREIEDSLLSAPAEQATAEVLLRAFVASAHVLEDNRESGIARLHLIAATPALQERDLAKGATITASIAAALERRGEPTDIANLAAAVGWATFHRAASDWIDDPARSLEQHLRSSFHALADFASPLRSLSP